MKTMGQSLFDALEGRVLMAVTPPATGLEGNYYNDANFGGPTALRFDRAVDFSWPGSPASGIDAGSYSVRWTGRIKATTTETYRIYISTESPVRLWLGDQLVV